MSAGQPQSLARFAPWFFMSSLLAAIFSPGFWPLVCVFFKAQMPRRPFGACLTKTLFDAKAQGILRDLDVVELWSGVGSIASAAQKAGYKVATVDLKFGEDLTTREGFEDAVNKVLRLKPGGLLSMGIECRSFVFLNSSNCKRNFYNQYAGDTKYEPVKTGNLFANEGKFFAELGFARDLIVVIENPPSSVLWSYLPASFMKKLPYSAVCNRCAFDDAPDGKRLSKKYKFFSNAPWITALQCPCTCFSDHISLTTYKDGQITGKPELLKESEAYPAWLGVELANAWMTDGYLGLLDVDGESCDSPDPKAKRARTWQSLKPSSSISGSSGHRGWQQL